MCVYYAITKREKTSGKGYSRDPDHRIPVTYFNIYKSSLKKLISNKDFCILLGNCFEIITLLITLVSYYFCSYCPIFLRLSDIIDNSNT